jgi:hypothetical protein
VSVTPLLCLCVAAHEGGSFVPAMLLYHTAFHLSIGHHPAHYRALGPEYAHQGCAHAQPLRTCSAWAKISRLDPFVWHGMRLTGCPTGPSERWGGRVGSGVSPEPGAGVLAGRLRGNGVALLRSPDALWAGAGTASAPGALAMIGVGSAGDAAWRAGRSVPLLSS